MQLNKSSLLLAVRRYSAAVREMEQTVLLPSLLRDVPSDDAWEREPAEESRADLYDGYLMLRAIRTTVESGLVTLDDRRAKTTTRTLDLKPPLEADEEELFHLHLSGLFSVLNKLTDKSQSLTDKYMEIIGAGC